MTDKPMLNLGCGRVILPAPRPAHHYLVDPAIYSTPNWYNVDRNKTPGVDKVMDLFTYGWDLKNDAYSGALLSHIIEHIPHEIKVHEPDWTQSVALNTFANDFADWRNRLHDWNVRHQDGWYAFWAELYRVLENNAIVHVLCPYAWSAGAVTDHTHTRLITEHTFGHSMQPDPNAPFEYATGGINFEGIGFVTDLLPTYHHLIDNPSEDKDTRDTKRVLREQAIRHKINIVYTIYAQLRVVK